MDNIELVLGILAVFAAFGVAMWQMFEVFSKRVIKPIEDNSDKIGKIDEKFTGEIRQIHTKITEITKEVKPNGGSSMKDVQQKIYESVRVLHDRDLFNFYLDSQPKFECDSNGLCIRVNDAFTELTGLSEANCLGNSWMNIVPDSMREDFYDKWVWAIEKNTNFDRVLNLVNGVRVRIKANRNERMIMGAVDVVK